MKIEKITIKKFRSVEKASFAIDSINAIVGANNSGKSSLLRALNAFFNYNEEKQYFENGIHRYVQRTLPKIEILFSNIPSEFRQYTFNNKLQIEVTVHPSSNSKRTIKYRANGTWNAVDESIISRIKKHINFVFIPPNRDGKSLVEVENNVLNLLIEAYLDRETQNRDNYTAKFLSAFDYLETHALFKISKEAKKEYPIDKNFRFEIKYPRDLSYKDFLKDVFISINESGLTHPLIECGTGVQSLTIISLYNLLGKLKNENIVIGLEEPETNLHPQAQREMISYFKQLIKKGSILHFFFTTHSSEMIDAVEHKQVIYFRKTKDSKRGFKSQVLKLSSDFFDKNSLDEFKYYQFHRYKNSDFFFSRFVIITESKNEAEIIKLIAKISDIELETGGISFLTLDGIDNVRYPIYLMNELNIPFLLIVDKDFFTPYLRDSFEGSMDSNGFPRYKNEYKNKELIDILITSEPKKAELLRYLKSNHTKASNILEKHNIIAMRYSLDIDLVAIPKGQSKYHELLSTPQSERTTLTLLKKRKGIKKITRIIEVLESLNSRNWPHSYSRIKNYLQKKVKELKNT